MEKCFNQIAERLEIIINFLFEIKNSRKKEDKVLFKELFKEAKELESFLS